MRSMQVQRIHFHLSKIFGYSANTTVTLVSDQNKSNLEGGVALGRKVNEVLRLFYWSRKCQEEITENQDDG